MKYFRAHFVLPVVARVLADIERSAVSLPGYIWWRDACGLTAEHGSRPHGYCHIEGAWADGGTH